MGETHAYQNHPLTLLLEKYIDEFDAIKETHLDMSNIAFQRRYGLSVYCPSTWDVLSSVYLSLKKIRGKVLVIFSSTSSYTKISDKLSSIGDRVQYISWHEIFTGMHVSQSDVRYMQKVKSLLSDAEFTFFIDPPGIPEVISQVRGQTINGLIILSGQQEE